MDNQEFWKIIPNTDNVYMVSNCGRVKSLKNNKELILKAGKDKAGYLCVGLHINKKSYTNRVHVLVACAFLNHIPDKYKVVVDHIDNNKLNNHVSNLQLVSQRENTSKNSANISGIKSKYPGVSYYKRDNCWRAYIRINGKLKHLGYFETELEAYEKYKNMLGEI